MNRNYISIILIFVSIVIFAQNQDTIKIQEVLIIDSSSTDYNAVYPNIDPKKSAGELMKSIPGVSITKRSSFSIEPSINSFKYDQINTTINGGMTASSSCPNRMDPIATRLSSDEIKKIEIVRGPYEVRYGQIMGGYINLITNKNPYYKKLNFGGNIASEYAFNGNGTVSSANIKGGNKIFDLDINANIRKFDNYTSGDGTEISSSYKTYGISSGLGLNISEKQRVFINYIYSEAKDVMHAGLPMDAKYDKSNILSLDYEFNNIGKVVTKFKLKLFGANEDHLMTNEYRPNAQISLANTPVVSNDLGARFEFTLNPFENSLMHIGADFKQIAKDGNKEITQFKNPCTNPPTVFPIPVEKEFEVWQNSYSQNFGAFIDFKYYFSEKLNLKAGLRTNYIKSDVKEAEQDFIDLYDGNIKPDDILSFNYFTKLKYILPKSYELEFAVGHGTRNPSLLERYINHFTVGLDAYEYVGNPHLKSETNNQVNLTLNKKYKAFHTYLDIFYSQIDNYITAVVDTTIPRKFLACKDPKFAKRFVNIDKAQQYGVNFGLKVFFLKRFTANIDLSYVYAENLDFNEPLPEIAPFTSLFTLTYKKKNLSINLQNEYQAKQTRVSELVGERESEEFTVFNISASYLFFKKLKFGLALDNIFDVNYYQHLSRPYKNMDTTSMFYEPGRNFKIFIKYTF